MTVEPPDRDNPDYGDWAQYQVDRAEQHLDETEREP